MLIDVLMLEIVIPLIKSKQSNKPRLSRRLLVSVVWVKIFMKENWYSVCEFKHRC